MKKLVVAALLVAAACGDGPTAPSARLEGTWRLVSLQESGQAVVSIANPDTFTVGFEANGRLAVRADCNSCGGSYTVNGDRLDIADGLACTRVFCTATAPLDTRFVAVLAAADRYATNGGELVLSGSGGTLRLRR